MSTSATLDQKARAWSLLAAGTCLLPLLLQLPGLLDVGIGVVAAGPTPTELAAATYTTTFGGRR